ncbi:MAG TPA: DUF6174 domain-containing protein [Dehalococcoidia bacterium]|nr:DUF6174 domain-containing protein [Dehalococcoidia bacterium]
MTSLSSKRTMLVVALAAAVLVTASYVTMNSPSTSGNALRGTPTPTAAATWTPTPEPTLSPPPSPSPISSVSSSDLQAQRVKWNATGIRSYRYALRLSCFCGFLNPYSVTVSNGATESLVDGQGQRVTDYPFLTKLATVEGLFGQVELLTTTSNYSEEVVYDATYGFPTMIASDGAALVTDDEMTIQVSDFTVIQPESLPRTGGPR